MLIGYQFVSIDCSIVVKNNIVLIFITKIYLKILNDQQVTIGRQTFVLHN